MSSGRVIAIVFFATCLAGASTLHSISSPWVEGEVETDTGPANGASVGWQGESKRVLTDASGRFQLPSSRLRRLIATKAGYRIASSGTHPISLRLQPLPTNDNPAYAWIDPHPDHASPNNCGNCHTEIYREWRTSAHANSVTNPKFLGVYAGSAKTWNARFEHPDGSDVCAKCHAPTLDSPTLDYDVRAAAGVARSGVHCDYCHKVADAPVDKLGTRFGRDGLMLLRPAAGDTLTFGPLDDAIRPGESFAHTPFYKESRYCASCHEGVIFGVHAYGTYSEWLDSPAKQRGTQCQDCHMTPTGTLTNIAPGKGGIERNPKTLASHHMPGGMLAMLRRSLSLQAIVNVGGRLDVEVKANVVGHRVPTGFVDRHLILVVEAKDANGNRAKLVTGPTLPRSAGNWSGRPGVLYAKQLIGDEDRVPTPFWLPVLRSVDTRLLPEETDRRAFLFGGDVATVRVQLWYRRFWHEVAQARGWSDNDVLVSEQILNWRGEANATSHTSRDH
jgi:hypothetical protein